MILVGPKFDYTSHGYRVEDGVVGQWFVTEGEAFKQGDRLVEIETAAGVHEIDALTDGVLVEILRKQYDVCASEEPLAVIGAS